MTIRGYIRRRVLLVFGVVLAGLLVCNLLIGNNLKAHDPRYVLGIALLLVIGPSFVLPQLIRCPNCSRRLGRMATRLTFSLIGRMKNCPYCGVDLDEPVPRKAIS